MTLDPFSKLYQIDKWVVEHSPLYPFSVTSGSIVAMALILAFWIILFLGLKLLFPAETISIWLNSNWGWAFVATALAYAGYSFCRSFLETKTFVRGSDVE